MVDRDAELDADLDRADALRTGLAALGEPEPLRSDDLLRAEGTLRAFQGARRRRTKLRAAWMGSVSAVAAVLVLGWWSLSRVQVLSIEVSEGVLELQQDRLALGDAVPTGEWIDIAEGRACMRIAARDLCGERGTRLRFDASGGLELAHGRVRMDDGLRLTTVLGTIAADRGALDLEIDELGTVTVHEGSATLHGAATDTELGHGTHVLAPPQLGRQEGLDVDAVQPVLE
ncbi:MAG: hypothetical protein IAG13_19575, partial [Deltaproteobacteria bacterium]|nr:hypothetical protein [Nannocystaceae bacterium]